MLEHLLKLISFIRINVLLVAKVVTLITCIYYITKYQEYEIKIGFFRDILPTRFVGFLDNTVGMGGTTMLMIPASIIILSFLMDNVVLKLVSGYLGVFGTFLSLIKGFYKGVLGEIADYGIFVVRHIATLQQKRAWFDAEIDRYYFSIQNLLPEKLTFISKFFTPRDYITYENSLSQLATLEDVKIYALSVITKLSIQYDTLPKPRYWYHTVQDFVTSPGFIISCVLAITAYGVVLWVGNTDAWKSFTMMQAELGKAGTLDALVNQKVTTQVAVVTIEQTVILDRLNDFSAKLSAYALRADNIDKRLATQDQQIISFIDENATKNANNTLHIKKTIKDLCDEIKDLQDSNTIIITLSKETRNALLNLCFAFREKFSGDITFLKQILPLVELLTKDHT